MAIWHDPTRLLDRIFPSRRTIAGLQAQVARLSHKVTTQQQASGVEFTFGEFTRELNTAFRGDKRWETQKKMEADAHVHGALRRQTLPLMNATWTVEPASDSARDEEIAEFVSANLLRRGGDRYDSDYWIESSFEAQRLGEILDMLSAGFSLFHKRYRRVGTKVVFDRLVWLEPSSVDPRGWVLDADDRLTAVKRTFQDPTARFRALAPIPADELALYVWDMKGARLDGRAYTRSMFGAWFRKDLAQRYGAIWAQKVGAPAPVVNYPADLTPDEIEVLTDFVKQLRGTAPAEAFGVFRMGRNGEKVEVKFAGADQGEVDRMVGIVDSENAEIAHAGGTKTQLLGESETGSRAVGEVQVAGEMEEVQATAKIVCEWETHGVGQFRGVIQELVDLNFAGVQKYPSLVCSKIRPYEDLDTLDQTIKAVSVGLVPKHPDLRRQVTERLGYALPDDAYEIEEPPIAPVVPVAPPEQDDEDDPEKPSASLALAAHLTPRQRDRLTDLLRPVREGAPRSGRRHPTRIEQACCNLAAIRDRFLSGERQVAERLAEAREAMVEQLIGQLRDGKIEPRNLPGLRQMKFRRGEGFRRQVVRVLDDIGGDAAAQVEQEIESQERRGAA